MACSTRRAWPEVELTAREAGDVLILEPREGRLDAHVAGEFRGQLFHYIDEGRRNLVLNLQRVSFVDSAGLSAMVSGVKRLGAAGALRVCGAQPPVRSMFELTRLHRVLSVLETEEDALASFAP